MSGTRVDWTLLTVERHTDPGDENDGPETFGVYVWSPEYPPGWVCVAVSDDPRRAAKHVQVYQDIHRGHRKVKVDRCGGSGDCGYCGRAHQGTCTTDNLGNPA